MVNMQFSHVLTRSNVDKSTHGVVRPAWKFKYPLTKYILFTVLYLILFSLFQYIPPNIQPPSRKWVPYKKILIRTDNGEWSVGITLCGSRARLSAGWNRFSKDNNLNFNQTLFFTLLPDNGNGVIFYVERQ